MPAERLRGRVVRPGALGYEDARRVWNGLIDRRPAAVVRCADDRDVAVAVGFARDNGLPLAVRGGGHGVAGQAVCDDGVVVDLSEMREVDVDPQGRTVRAEGGCELGDLDRATYPYGLAVPLGVVSATGIAGLTLSGGIGWLRRRYGLSCDNLLGATVVTADGRRLETDADRHPDLFWGIRGGGGNFGAVTSFTFRLRPVGPDVFVCMVLYPADRAGPALRACTRYLAEEPEQAAPVGVFGHVPAMEPFPAAAHGERFVALLAVHPGPAADGERALAPLRQAAEPIVDLSAVMPWPQAQSLLDEDYPDGHRYYWKSVNVPELDDDTVKRIAEHAAAAPSPDSTVDIWFQGGAMARVGEQDTAFAHRDAPYLLGVEGNWSDPADSPRNVAWVRHTVADLRTLSDGGTYLNFPGFLEEGEQLMHEGYGRNYDRLAAIKARYDPGNLFRLNPNIAPRG